MAEVFELNVQNLQQLQRLQDQEELRTSRDFLTSEILPDDHPECKMTASLNSLFVPPERFVPESFYRKRGSCKGVDPSPGDTSDVCSLNSTNESEDEGIYPPDLDYGLVHTDTIRMGGDKILWETHHVALYREPGLGFGIAISGGVDNPHFSSGETSIAVSGVLKGGPADNLLKVNDRITSINGISMEDSNHSQAISFLRDSGEMVDLLIKRKVFVPSPHKKLERTITIDKMSDKADVGLGMGCRYFVKNIKSGSLLERNCNIEEGDYILKVNGQSTENLTFAQTQRLIDRTKGRLSLLLERPPKSLETDQQRGEYSASDSIYHWTMQQAASSGYHSPTASQGGRSRANSKMSQCEETRYVNYQKENNRTGLSMVGGNQTGVYISRVEGGGAAQREGLHEGDLVLQINGVPVRGMTKEQVVKRLENLPTRVDLLVTDRREEYSRLFTSTSSEGGDEFYIKASFTHNSLKTQTAPARLSMKPGDVFKVTDTLPSHYPGCWVVVRMSPDGEELEPGIIPNQITANNLFKASSSYDKTNFARSFGKDQWQKIILEGTSLSSEHHSKVDAYERVTLEEAYLPRPVIIYGALAELCRTKLAATYPNLFEVPRVTKLKTGPKSKEVLKFADIQKISDSGKHCLLDLPPHSIDKLISYLFHPIVINVSSDTAELKDNKLSKGLKKLDRLSEKIERDYPQLISACVSITRGKDWLQQVCDVIAQEQEKAVWVREGVVSNAPSYCSSDYFSLDSNQSFGSRGDLRKGHYSSQPCLHFNEDARKDGQRSNSNNFPASLPTARARSSTDPYRGLCQSDKLSSLDRCGSLPRPAFGHVTLKHVKEGKEGVEYDNCAFQHDEATDSPKSGRTSGIWYTGKSLSLQSPNSKGMKKIVPAIREVEESLNTPSFISNQSAAQINDSSANHL
ncbi:tight junction protein ZO-1-like [Watersipora subatra]|uniref:tight junction protein ZO-1-like n=1 Tax=Watersipora subatra TaxID=2589382 RepID=UPI00355BA015